MRRSPLALALALSALSAPMSDVAHAQDARFAAAAVAPPVEPALAERPANARIIALPVSPGAILTSPLPLVAPPNAVLGSYVVLPAPAVRMFGETYGSLRAAGMDTIQLPFTYSIPRASPSGRARLARVVVQWDDGTMWIADVEADVQSRHGLRVVLSSESGVAHRGKPASLRLVVTNLGNAEDTLSLRWNAGGDWRLNDAPLVLVVPAGATVLRAMTVRCPGTATPGEVHIAQVTAVGRGGAVSAAATVRVSYDGSAGPGFVEAPSTLFLGTTIDDDGSAQPSLSLRSEGDLASDTHFSLVARRRERAMPTPVLAEELGGQGFRLAVRRQALSAAVGDVWRRGSSLTGLVAQGRGVDLAWREPRFDASLLLARPDAGGAGSRSVGQADVGFATAFGRVGASFTHLERAGVLPADSGSVQSAGLTFAEGERGRRFASAEIGALRLADTDGHSTLGVGFDGEIERSSDLAGFAARVHAIPSSPAARDLMPTTAFLSGNFAVTDRVRALGTGSATRLRSELGVLTAQGASAGTSVLLGDAQATILATVRHLRTGGDSARSTTGRGASVALSVPVKAVTLDGYAEHGVSLSPDALDRNDLLRAGARWSGEAGWFWVGATWARSGEGSETRGAEVNGAYRVGRAELQAGTSALVSPPLLALGDASLATPHDELLFSTFWTRLTVDAARDLAVVGGVSYQRTPGGSPWRISLGLRRRLSLPLPLHRAPVALGVAYEDQNGNRRRDEGEPGLAGVGLSLGMERAITAPDGRYAFVDPALRGQSLAVDVASLPNEYLLPPDARIGNAGHVDIPFVRAGGVTLLLYVDANGDSVRNDDTRVGEGVVVTIADSAGRNYGTMPDDDGTVRFRGLIPGLYTATVTLPPHGSRTGATRTMKLVLPPGQIVQVELPLPATQREVRFNLDR